MNKRNMKKNAPKIHTGYLTSKQQKAVKWYEQKRKENKQSVLKFTLRILYTWHRYHISKYEYLAAGCINEKIKKELEEKKLYHRKKYNELSFGYEEKTA